MVWIVHLNEWLSYKLDSLEIKSRSLLLDSIIIQRSVSLVVQSRSRPSHSICPWLHVTPHKRHLSNDGRAGLLRSLPLPQSIINLPSPCFKASFSSPSYFFPFIPSLASILNSLSFSFLITRWNLFAWRFVGWVRSSCGLRKYGSSPHQVYGAY